MALPKKESHPFFEVSKTIEGRVPDLLFGLPMFGLHVSQTCVQLLETLVDLCASLGQSGLFHLQTGDLLLQLLHVFL